MTREQFITDLASGSGAMGVHLNDLALDRMFLYYTELQRWNRRVNLVSRKEHDWIRVHFLDSLAALGFNLLGKECRVVDLGAGAGFPGVPLKLAREDIFLGMAEASGRKCAWLRHLVRTLSLENIQVLEGRIEDTAKAGRAGCFDVVVSRAAARPSRMLDLSRPFLSDGGRILIYTTEDLLENEGRVYKYRVPGLKAPRVIWEVKIN